MLSIAQYRANIQAYRVLRGNVEQTALRLSAAGDRARDIDHRVKNNYQVDGGNATITNKTSDLQSDLYETADFLRSQVIPAIDSAISEADNNIAYLEEEERRRREEEERRREEEEEERRRREEEENN